MSLVIGTIKGKRDPHKNKRQRREVLGQPCKQPQKAVIHKDEQNKLTANMAAIEVLCPRQSRQPQIW